MKIAIIGGGASAISVVDKLFRTLKHSTPSNLSITIIEPSKVIGPGRAYYGDGHYALLNRQAEFMSIRSDYPSHFLNWLQQNIDEHSDRQAYVPRWLFGSYLIACFKELLKIAKELKISLEVMSTSVTQLQAKKQKIMILTASQTYLEVDAAVLCIGTMPPKNLFNLPLHSDITINPYPIHVSCANIAANQHVGIIGSSLTAIDIVLGLKAQAHLGPITMVSRRGMLPAVRYPSREISLQYITPDKLDDLFQKSVGGLEVARQLVEGEFKQQGISFRRLSREFTGNEAALKRLNRHIEANGREQLWQPVFIKIFQTYIERFWHQLSPTEKYQILSAYHPILMSLCNPMPLPTAHILRNLLHSRQLTIMPMLSSVEPHKNNGFLIKAAGQCIKVDKIVNAARPAKPELTAPLSNMLQPLLDSGSAQLSQFGGIKVDIDTLSVVAKTQDKQTNIFAIGELTAGELYYTSSLPMITRQVDRMVPALISILNNGLKNNVAT